MAESIRGIVEEVINNGKGKGSGVRIEGKKYGVYDPADAGLDQVTVGSEVSFRFNEKPGTGGITYKNITGKITTVTAGSGAVASVPSNVNTVSLGRDRAIIRQNALTNAVNACAQFSITVEGDEIIDSIIKTAMRFEEYTSGDLDQKIMEEMDKSFDPEG